MKLNISLILNQELLPNLICLGMLSPKLDLQLSWRAHKGNGTFAQSAWWFRYHIRFSVAPVLLVRPPLPLSPCLPQKQSPSIPIRPHRKSSFTTTFVFSRVFSGSRQPISGLLGRLPSYPSLVGSPFTLVNGELTIPLPPITVVVIITLIATTIFQLRRKARRKRQMQYDAERAQAVGSEKSPETEGAAIKRVCDFPPHRWPVFISRNSLRPSTLPIPSVLLPDIHKLAIIESLRDIIGIVVEPCAQSCWRFGLITSCHGLYVVVDLSSRLVGV